MHYDFIAEFFAKPIDKEPIYRTRLNEIQSEENFLKDNGFTEVAFNPDYDYVLETDIEHLQRIVPAEPNPEMLTIYFDAEVCERVRITAYEFCCGEEAFVGFCYGKDFEYSVVFEGNRPDDKVIIETCGGPITAPLEMLKERFNVLTQFEVAERLEKRINDVLKNGLEDYPKNTVSNSRIAPQE